MKKVIAVTAMLLFVTVFGTAQDIAGEWKGTLSAGGQELHLVLHVSKNDSGSLTATLDSVD